MATPGHTQVPAPLR